MHCHLGCPAVRLACIATVWCCIVLRVVQACTATTLDGDCAALFMLCWHALPLYCLARSATVLFGTHCQCWHALPLCCVWHAMPTSSVTHAVRGYHKSSYYFVFSTHRFFIILCCVWHALPTSRVTRAVRGLQQVLLLLLCSQHTAFLLFTPFLLVRNVHSCLSGM